TTSCRLTLSPPYGAVSPAVQIRYRLELLRLGRLQREAARERGRPLERDHETLRRQFVVVVDVVPEMHSAVAPGPARQINPRNRPRMCQADVGARAAGDAGVDLAPAPAQVVLQQPGGKRAHVADAGATGGMETIVGAEQLTMRRVVHVDRMRIRHIDA